MNICRCIRLCFRTLTQRRPAQSLILWHILRKFAIYWAWIPRNAIAPSLQWSCLARLHSRERTYFCFLQFLTSVGDCGFVSDVLHGTVCVVVAKLNLMGCVCVQAPICSVLWRPPVWCGELDLRELSGLLLYRQDSDVSR